VNTRDVLYWSSRSYLDDLGAAYRHSGDNRVGLEALEPGNLVDLRDPYQKWYLTRVVRVDDSEVDLAQLEGHHVWIPRIAKITFHYLGWPDSYDEQISTADPAFVERVRAPFSRTKRTHAPVGASLDHLAVHGTPEFVGSLGLPQLDAPLQVVQVEAFLIKHDDL